MNDNTKTPLKKLPWQPTKGQVYNMYKDPNGTKVKKQLYPIMMDNRKHIPKDKRTDGHDVFHTEFVELIKIMGTPEGYEDFEEIKEWKKNN